MALAEIRHATRADAAGIAAVHISSWEGAYRGIIPDEWFERRTIERLTEMWEGLLGPGSGAGIAPDHATRVLVLVAERDGTVCGFCSVNLPSRDPGADARTAEIGALYVEPTHWRGGAGTALMDATLAELTEPADWDEVTLWVLEANTRGRAFYASAGFTPDGARQPTGGDDPPELRLRRAVRAS